MRLSRSNTVATVARRRERGSVLAEMAIGMPIFAMSLFMLLSLLLLVYNKLALGHVLSRAMRQAITGQVLSESGQPFLDQLGNPQSLTESLESRIRELAVKYRTGDSLQISICPETNVDCSSNDIGAPGAVFFVSVQTEAMGVMGFRNTVQLTRSARRED